MKINPGMYSSASDEWATPRPLFDKLNKAHHFDLDPAATPENALCKRFYTKEMDGLSLPWDGSVFVNPPYSAIKKWVFKARDSVNAQTVMLLPARTDTVWFHDGIVGTAAGLLLIRGRLKFGGGTNSAPFPSMLVFYRCVPWAVVPGCVVNLGR